MSAIEKYNHAKASVERIVHVLKAIKVTDETSLASAKLTLKEAKEVIDEIEAKRVELKAPVLQQGRDIDGAAAELKNPLELQINEAKKEVLAFEQEKERKRLEELARINAEREAKEKAEREERQRVERIDNAILDIERNAVVAIDAADTVAKIDDVLRKLNGYEPKFEFFMEKLAHANEAKQRAIKSATVKRDSLVIIEEQQKEMARLSGIEKEQAKLKADQEAESLRLKQESDRLQRESEKLEQQKAQAKVDELAEAKRIVEEQARKEAEKQLELDKSKSLRNTWVFELTDLALVPREYLMLDEAKVKAAIKENKDRLANGLFTIPGINIHKEQSVVIK